MPITKQAIKRMRQDKVRRARNKHYSSETKSMLKLVMSYIQNSDFDKAKAILPKVVSSIDTAAKKGLIHANNAARKKSQIEKALTAALKNPVPPKAEAPKKVESAEKKSEAPKAAKKPAAKKPAAKKTSAKKK